MIVLDTNVVSELMRLVPAPSVIAWVRTRPPRDLYTTAITVAEVRYGIARLPDGRRKDQLADAAADVFLGFPEQVLAFDAAAAVAYAGLVAARERAGVPIDGFNAQIAAICRTSHATLATRYVGDFHGTGIEVVDPWQEPPHS
jgi:predicted nucleic acid-binding protein